MGCGVTGVEYAAEVRRGSPFPRRWGVPPGEPNSVDRLTWVKMRCWDEEFLKARRLDGSTAVALLEELRPELTATEAFEHLEALRRSP